MEHFKNSWKLYLYCMWLGGSLYACFGAQLTDLRFWVVLLPTVAMVTLFNQNGFDRE